MRGILKDFSAGDLSTEIRLRGEIPGRLKALQAHLLHLTWQIQQVADGDFSQRVDFLGEFSRSFNNMVTQLDTALTSLQRKEEELTELTLALQNEITQKELALAALRKSEARFRYLAEHDPLTNILNRRSFFDLAHMELQHTKLQRQSCCLCMLDLDNFKAFNDAYGHMEGDAALKHVSAVCKANIRQSDYLGRYGGEEFIFLFPKMNRAQGLVQAERLRAAIENTPLNVAGKDVTLTASIGLVHVPPDYTGEADFELVDEVVRTADSLLYEAKHHGRNQVHVANLFSGNDNAAG